jgi:hypothetical protein
MSIFFSLCRTDADDLLSWPFEQRVTVTLIDQGQNDGDGRRLHICHTVDPAAEHPKSVCRPTSDRGQPFGIRQFVRLQMLNVPDRYVVDNAVMLRFQIE